MTVSGPDRNNPDTIVHDLLTPCRSVITVFIIKPFCTKRKSKSWFNLSLLQPRHKGSQGDDLDGRPRRKASWTKGSAISSYTCSTGRKASETKVSANFQNITCSKAPFPWNICLSGGYGRYVEILGDPKANRWILLSWTNSGFSDFTFLPIPLNHNLFQLMTTTWQSWKSSGMTSVRMVETRIWDLDEVVRVDNYTQLCGVKLYACMDSLSDFVI